MSWFSSWPRCRKAALVATATWAGLFLATGLVVAISDEFKWDLPPPQPDKNWAVDDWRSDQCETLHRDSVVRERQNTWSNMAYLYAGILVMFRARRLLTMVFGVQLCLLAFTSGLYHASVLGFWQTADIFGVYCVLVGLCCVAGETFWRRSAQPAPLWYLLSCLLGTPAISLAAAIWRGESDLLDSTVVFIFLVTVLLGLLIWLLAVEHGAANKHGQQSSAEADQFFRGCGSVWDHVGVFLLYLVLIAGPAFVVRLLDGVKGGDRSPKPLCCAEGMGGLLQAHALWHVMSALALLVGYDLFARAARDDSRIFCDD